MKRVVSSCVILKSIAGNDMYKLFLDASMTYSCGIWAKGALCK